MALARFVISSAVNSITISFINPKMDGKLEV